MRQSWSEMHENARLLGAERCQKSRRLKRLQRARSLLLPVDDARSGCVRVCPDVTDSQKRAVSRLQHLQTARQLGTSECARSRGFCILHAAQSSRGEPLSGCKSQEIMLPAGRIGSGTDLAA